MAETLSLKCPSCGSTILFTRENVATYCSFCGNALPDMKDFVLKSADMKLAHEQNDMEIRKLNTQIRKEKVKNFGETAKTVGHVANSISMIVKGIIIIATLVFVIYILAKSR